MKIIKKIIKKIILKFKNTKEELKIVLRSVE